MKLAGKVFGVIAYIIGAVACLAYASSLLFEFEMAEPKALLYVGAFGYFIDSLSATIQE